MSKNETSQMGGCPRRCLKRRRHRVGVLQLQNMRHCRGRALKKTCKKKNSQSGGVAMSTKETLQKGGTKEDG